MKYLLKFFRVCFWCLVPLILFVIMLDRKGTATDQTYHWMASLTNKTTNLYENRFCGATFLNPKWVLTAAHCVVGGNGDLYVAFGSSYLTQTTKLVKAELTITHPQYNYPRRAHDIALVKVEKPVYLNSYPELSSDINFSDPKPGTLLGWGTMIQDHTVTPNSLQKRYLKIWPQPDCKKAYGSRYHSGSMICAADLATFTGAEDGSDACFGDSGGPLLAPEGDTLYIVGIVSWGRECNSSTHPTVYANVPELKNWILTTIEENNDA